MVDLILFFIPTVILFKGSESRHRAGKGGDNSVVDIIKYHRHSKHNMFVSAHWPARRLMETTDQYHPTSGLMVNTPQRLVLFKYQDTLSDSLPHPIEWGLVFQSELSCCRISKVETMSLQDMSFSNLHSEWQDRKWFSKRLHQELKSCRGWSPSSRTP